jgi:hypothetical protein
MARITDDHREWAVVGRLRRMLEEPPHNTFSVTQTYALFTAVLCWVMQRIRNSKIENEADRIAASVFEHLSSKRISDQPWAISLAPSGRIARIGTDAFHVQAPSNFEDHTASRFLINLRDAVAHGDARNVSPFNVPTERVLAGFTFRCSERHKKDRRKVVWRGEITLLEDDMRRIGGHLAKIYCDALRRSEAHRKDSHFGTNAARSLREVAAV